MKPIFLVLFISYATAFAQLSWENRQQDFHPSFTDAKIVAEFKFTNLGKYPVTIESTKTSCGCTTADLEKKVYLPGEKGKITTTYTIGQQAGFQQKTVTVVTDDKSDPIAQLTLRAFIPELIELTPAFVSWGIGEKPEPKTINVKVAHTSSIRLLDVKSTNERLFAQLKTVKAGAQYVITVTPLDTAEPGKASIVIQTDFPKEKPRNYTGYAEIKQGLGATGSVKK